MIGKKSPPNQSETVAELRKNITQSVFSRSRVRVMTFLGRLKRSTQNYRIPLIASSIFIILVLSFGVVRQLQRTSLLSLINRATNGTDDYATLLSADQTDEFVRDDTSEPERDTNGTIISSSNSTQSTSTSFTVNEDTSNSNSGSSSGSSGGSSSGGSGGGSSGSGGSGGGDTEPPPPFSASIDSFSQGTTKLDCKNPSNPKIGNCSKVYSFNARVSTKNGPGTVAYRWQSSQGGSSGSLSAGEGSTITAVTREITIECKSPTVFTIQFSITSPSISNSDILSVVHACNEI